VIELRSYRRVFELERRIYRIDRLRLNPAGVPVRGVVYFLALVSVSVLTSATPALGALEQPVPWYLRALVLPGLGAALLALIRIEGRPFHLAAGALAGYLTSPRRLAGLTRRASVGCMWLPEDIVLLPDGSDPHLRALRYTGPGSVLVTVRHRPPVAPSRWRAALGRRAVEISELHPSAPLPSGEVVVLARGARLRTCSSATAGRSPRAPDAGRVRRSGDASA
jgi:hypothetical protein